MPQTFKREAAPRIKNGIQAVETRIWGIPSAPRTVVHGSWGKIRGVRGNLSRRNTRTEGENPWSTGIAFPLRSKYPEGKICGVQEGLSRSKTILGTLDNPFLWANIVLGYVRLGVVGIAVHYTVGASELFNQLPVV